MDRGASTHEEDVIVLQGEYDKLTSGTNCNKSIREKEKQDEKAALGASPLLLNLADLTSVPLFP